MLFSSMAFLVLFLPAALAGYFLLPDRARNLWLLAVSMVFYAWGEPKFVVVMAASIAINYLFGLAVDRVRGKKGLSRLCLFAMAAVNLGILGYFKYLNFFVENVNQLAGREVLAPTSIALPIGISFFTFQAMSYVIDVYRRNGEVQKNILNVGLYIAFFPQLIAGPIVRYETFSWQIKNRKVTPDGFSAGVRRFLYGFIKKVLIANTMAVIADYIFSLPARGELTMGGAWLGAAAYTFQIYFDFSAYSDMAIGLGRMFGFQFPENFRYPYMAESVTDFWRRWHISLSTWFRDYVYFPLGGSRVDKRWKLVRNLFAVWFLTGVWHGANWTFVCWGLFYFALLTAEKLFGIPERMKRLRLGAVYRALTLLFVVCGWVLFRAESLGEAAVYLKAMFGISAAHPDVSWTLYYVWEYRWYFLAAILGSTPLVGRMLAWADGEGEAQARGDFPDGSREIEPRGERRDPAAAQKREAEGTGGWERPGTIFPGNGKLSVRTAGRSRRRPAAEAVPGRQVLREAARLAVHGAVFLLFLAAASELVIGAHNPFIYFNF